MFTPIITLPLIILLVPVMANASAKKTGLYIVSPPSDPPFLLTQCFSSASQNEAAIQNLFYGQLLSHLLPLVVRWLLKTHTTKKVVFFFTFSFIVSQFIYHRLVKMGTPKRDSIGQLISSGEDLNQPGVTEWMFDVLYVACEPATISISHELLTDTS